MEEGRRRSDDIGEKGSRWMKKGGEKVVVDEEGERRSRMRRKRRVLMTVDDNRHEQQVAMRDAINDGSRRRRWGEGMRG